MNQQLAKQQAEINTIEVLDSFPGASIGDYTVASSGSRIFASLREEPLVKKDGTTHDYNAHFAVGLKNNSGDLHAVELFINCTNKDNLNSKASIYGGRSLNADFQRLTQIEAWTDTFRRYYLKIPLPAKEVLYLGNTFFRSLPFVTEVFNELAKSASCRRQSYGKSVEGRDLFSFEYCRNNLDNRKPVILITCGFHPMEADTFAAEAVMEHLNTNQGKELLNCFNFVIIPLVNPDGFHYGYNGCNAKGINLYWDFRETDCENTPEAYYLWQYVDKIKPCLYIDFHAYTFQQRRKSAGPYLKPLYFYAGSKVKTAVSRINKELISLHHGGFAKGALTIAPSALSYKLTEKFNTIAYAKYHLHILNGKEGMKTMAVNIVERICECLREKNILSKDDILLFPHGEIKNSSRELLMRKLEVFWLFGLKPQLKKILVRRNKS